MGGELVLVAVSIEGQTASENEKWLVAGISIILIINRRTANLKKLTPEISDLTCGADLNGNC